MADKKLKQKVKLLKDIKLKNLIEYQPQELKKTTNIKMAKLKNSLMKNGLSSPFYIWMRKGKPFILDGHHRARALKELSAEGKLIPESVPCAIIDIKNEKEAKKALLAYNSHYADIDKNAFMDFTAEFDFDEIKFEFEPFRLGFTLPSPEIEEDEIPELPTEAKSQLGDLYELNGHRVLCGDSTIEKDIEKLMNGKKCDMIFTDPPYDINSSGAGDGYFNKSLNKQKKDIEFISSFDPLIFLDSLDLYFKKGCMNAYIFCNSYLLPDYLSYGKDKKYAFNLLVWKKPSAIPINASHRPDLEYLVVFRKKSVWNYGLDGVNYSKLLEFSRVTGEHPTMKPVLLIANEIKISSNKDSIVVDSFLGSGSTLIACEQTNRKCYGLELDPLYIDVIIQRWVNLTGQEKIKKNGRDIIWRVDQAS